MHRISPCARALGAIAALVEESISQTFALFNQVSAAVSGKQRRRLHRTFAGAMVLSALAFSSAPSTTRAAVILSDNFDSYTSQASFATAWPAIGTDMTAPSGLLSTAHSPPSSPNAVQIPGTAASNQYRNRRSFSETNTAATSGNLGVGQQIIWSFDFYDSAAASGPNRNFSNLQDTTAPTGTNQLISMGLNNNHTGSDSGGNYYMARILGYSPATTDPDGGPNEAGTLGSGAYFKLNDYGVGLRSTGWHNLKAVITTPDGITSNYAFYVDNALAETVNGVGSAGSLRSYDNIVLGSGLSNGSQEADFDNVNLSVVAAPEPAVVSLLGMVALGLVRRRNA